MCLLSVWVQMYGPVSSFSQSLIAQLGGVAVEMSVEELSSLRLTERRSIAAVGAISTWSQRQVAHRRALLAEVRGRLHAGSLPPPILCFSSQLSTLFAVVLNSTKQSPSQLDSSTLVAMGHIVCGAKTTEMNLFNAVEFR